jgi:dUTP pyrophosphatase
MSHFNNLVKLNNEICMGNITADAIYYYSTNRCATQVECLVQDPKLLPQRQHPTDAGADLRSAETCEIYPGEQRMVDTGVAVKVPPGYVGYVFNRSSQGTIGVTIPHSVGVIDSDYRGNIKVILKNNGEDPYQIERGVTRIAQLVISPVMLAEFVDVWNDTERGTGGFGSTGT